METAEEQLDMALSKACIHFDEKHYAKLQRAYQLLGKTHTCVDQLLMHFASAIHNTAFGVVHGFAGKFGISIKVIPNPPKNRSSQVGWRC